MSEESTEPPLAWRYAGSQVKLWREEADITREQLAAECNYGVDYVKSMEYGRRKPTKHLLDVADSCCGARGKLIAAAEYLRPEKFPTRAGQFMAAEAEALAVHWYEVLLIPGLLQKEPYLRTLMEESCPPLGEDKAESRIQARLERQEAMKRRRGTLFSFVIYEAALRSGLGGAEVMKDQLQYLLSLGESANISVQVVPYGRGNGVTLGGTLVLLDNPDHSRYAYVEGQGTSVLHSDAGKVADLSLKYAMIGRHTLSVEQSAVYIRKVASEL